MYVIVEEQLREKETLSPSVSFFSKQHLHHVLCAFLSEHASDACTVARPSWVATHSKDMYAQLPAVLANRTLLYLGDSVSYEEYLQLAALVALHAKNSPRVATPLLAGAAAPTLPRPKCGAALNQCFNTGCQEWTETGFRLCYLAAGRFGRKLLRHPHGSHPDWSACFDPDLVLGSAIACAFAFGVLSSRSSSTRRDIVVANAGVHHAHRDGLTLNVESLLKEMGNNTRRGGRPCLLWRETFPQHFNTTTGTFGGFFGGRCSDGPQCRAITADALKGGRQMFNGVTNPLVSQAGIPIIRVFNAALSFWQLHPDCYEHSSSRRSCNPEHSSCAETAIAGNSETETGRGEDDEEGGRRLAEMLGLKYMAPSFIGGAGAGQQADCTHFPHSPVHELSRVLTMNAVERECGL